MALRIVFLVAVMAAITWQTTAAAEHAGIAAEHASVAAERARVGISVVEPWKFEKDGTIQGAGIDMLNELSRRLDIEFTYEIIPFKRGLTYMKTGKLDLMIGLLKRPEREAYIHFIHPPYKRKSNKAFYILKGSERILTTYEDLHHLEVGVKLGARYFPRFDRDGSISKQPVSNYRQNIQKLLLGRIDTFICTDSQADYLIHEMGLSDRLAKSTYGYNRENPTYLGISRKSPWMTQREKIENTLAKMVGTGVLDAVFINYFQRNNLPVPQYQ